MKFLQDLNESRLFPAYSDLRRYDAQQVSQYVYLYLCALQILRYEESTQILAARYAQKTIQWNSFKIRRTGATDLFVMLHGLLVDEDPWKHEKQSERFLDEISIDLPTLIMFLRDISTHTDHQNLNRKFFNNLDHRLRVDISLYRLIRRAVLNWPSLNVEEKRVNVTRLINTLQRKAPRSEVLPFLTQVARKHKWLTDDKPVKESFIREITLPKLTERVSLIDVGNNHVKVYLNPSHLELKTLFAELRDEDARGILVDENTVFVWNGYQATHGQMISYSGIHGWPFYLSPRPHSGVICADEEIYPESYDLPNDISSVPAIQRLLKAKHGPV